MMGERSQTQKATFLVKMFKTGKSIETEGSLVFAGGWWEEGIGCDCNGYRVSSELKLSSMSDVSVFLPILAPCTLAFCSYPPKIRLRKS